MSDTEQTAHEVLARLEPEMLIIAGSPQNDAFDIIREALDAARLAGALAMREQFNVGYKAAVKALLNCDASLGPVAGIEAAHYLIDHAPTDALSTTDRKES